MGQFNSASGINNNHTSGCHQFFTIILSCFFWLFLLYPAVSTAGQVTLAWDPNQEPDLSGYLVYWGTTPSQYDNSAIVENDTAYTVTGLDDGRIYYFAVTAYDSNDNESAYSAELAIQDGVVVDTAVLPVSDSSSTTSNAGDSCFINSGRRGTSVKTLVMQWRKLFKGEIQ